MTKELEAAINKEALAWATFIAMTDAAKRALRRSYSFGDQAAAAQLRLAALTVRLAAARKNGEWR